jgi:hypothetical protein
MNPLSQLSALEGVADRARCLLVSAGVIDDVPIHPADLCVALDAYAATLMPPCDGGCDLRPGRGGHDHDCPLVTGERS